MHALTLEERPRQTSRRSLREVSSDAYHCGTTSRPVCPCFSIRFATREPVASATNCSRKRGAPPLLQLCSELLWSVWLHILMYYSGETGYTHSLSPSRPPNNTLNTRQQRTYAPGYRGTRATHAASSPVLKYSRLQRLVQSCYTTTEHPCGWLPSSQ